MAADTASSSVPKRWREIRLRDAGWLLRYSARAVRELVAARRRFGHVEVRAMLGRATPDAPIRTSQASTDSHLVERIAFIVPRIAPLMPFRSDCLIQATGAQAWLAEYGVPSTIVIGVERPEDGPFAAHAWLEHEGMIVTGGDVSQYTVLL